MLPAVPSCHITMPTTDELAQLLLHAHAHRQVLDVAPDTGPADVVQAYAVQHAVWRGLSGDVQPAAWKIGAPNRATEPTAAAIFPRFLGQSPAEFSAGSFRRLGIEAEMAVCFGRDLPARATPYASEEILTAIASVHVAMELVDTRLADPDAAGPLWRLADSLLNGGLVFGAAIENWRTLDFSKLSVRVLANGRCLAETQGRPPLDDLFHCLPWWLAQHGGARAGDMITTGAWNGMHAVPQAAEVSVEFINAESGGVGRVNAVLA